MGVCVLVLGSGTASEAAAEVMVEVGGMCEEIGNEGEVESMPEVVYGVRSRSSGKCTRAVFLEAYAPKWTERLRCNASTGGGYMCVSQTRSNQKMGG